MTETISLEIPDYRIERELGSGAMATVYLAVHRRLQRQVALKVMAAALTANPTFRERFQREGVYIAQLEHPNIITVYDIGVHQQHYYMAMRYVAGGETLKDRISGRGMEPAAAVGIIRQIASALDCAHSHPRRIVHRDVKPANILFDDHDRAILSDFGIAKSTAENVAGSDNDEQVVEELTMAGHAVGTPAYMSPEQILGRAIDPRSDLYSLGVVLYETLTGQKPFRSDETIALAMMHVHDPIPRLPEDRPCAVLQPIIDRLMAKVPDQRYPSAAALIADLDALNLDHPSTPNHGLRWQYWLLGALAAGGVSGLAIYIAHEPACESPPLNAAQRQEIDQLKAVADLNFEFGRLISPPVSNAAYGYGQVLEIDPCHAAARQGLTRVADRLTEVLNEALAGANSEPRSVLLERAEEGLRWLPQHPGLLELRERLQQQ